MGFLRYTFYPYFSISSLHAEHWS